MHFIRTPITATAQLIALALASGSALLPLVAGAQSKPGVTVVNPASNPVNTRITNAVVPVEISNADAIPVTASEPEGSRQIYRKRAILNFDESARICDVKNNVTVPAGKRLVVEYLSAMGTFTSPIQLVSVWLEVDGANVLAVAPATSNATGNGVSFSAAGQYVRAYTDSNVSACAMVNGVSSQQVEVYVTGYLVDKP